MSFDVFTLTFKRIFKSLYCWMLVLISISIFLLVTYGFIHICLNGNEKPDVSNKKMIRSFYLFFLFIILGVVVSSLAEFAIDKQNLIFILSKQYKRINCLLEKIVALSIFLMIFIICLSLGFFLINIKTKEEYDLQIWANSELFPNCFQQIFLCTLYNVLFWSIATLYLNHKYCKLLLTLSQIAVISLYIYLEIAFNIKNEKLKNDTGYTLFLKEIFIPNVSYCPFSFITFILGLGYFYKKDLRI